MIKMPAQTTGFVSLTGLGLPEDPSAAIMSSALNPESGQVAMLGGKGLVLALGIDPGQGAPAAPTAGREGIQHDRDHDLGR